LYLTTKESKFPGWWALLPTIGAVLLISAGQKGWFNRNVLANPVFVWVGLISYPLYLWHWVLLVFARQVSTQHLSTVQAIGVIALSIGLAWVTYRLIETPIRRTKKAAYIIAMFLFMLATLAAGLLIYHDNGVPSRYPSLIGKLLSYSYDHKSIWREGTCFLRQNQDASAFKECKENQDGKALLLWGDSHAAHLYPGLIKNYGDKYRIVQRTMSACSPTLDFFIQGVPVHCEAVNRSVLDYIKASKPEKIILAGNWIDRHLPGLSKTIDSIRQAGVHDILIVGPVPRWKDSLPLPKALYEYFKIDPLHRIPSRLRLGVDSDNNKYNDSLMERFAYDNSIRYISLNKLLCNDAGCISMVNDSESGLIFFDNASHFTKDGSEYAVSLFELD
jgi:hypothetical protein